MLKNTRIGTKLIGGFLLVAALTAFIGIFAILRLQDISDQYRTHWQGNSRSLQDIGNATSAYQRLRVNVRDYVVAANDDQERIALDKVNARIEEFQRAFDEFLSMPMGDEERVLAQKVKSSWEDYGRANYQIINSRQEEKLKEANELIIKSTPLTSRLTQDLESLVELEDKLSDVNQRAVSASADSVVWVLTVVISVIVLLAVSVGASLTFAITRPLREMVGAAQTLAEGDASKDVHHSSSDELGQMADALVTR